MNNKTTEQLTTEYLHKIEQLCQERGMDAVLRELQNFNYTPADNLTTLVDLTTGLREILLQNIKYNKHPNNAQKIMDTLLAATKTIQG